MKTLLSKLRFVFPIKVRIGVKMNPHDKITFRPRLKENEHIQKDSKDSSPAPESKFVPGSASSQDSQDVFDRILIQQREAHKEAIEDLEKAILSYESKIEENRKMIEIAKKKLGHIEKLLVYGRDGLIE